MWIVKLFTINTPTFHQNPNLNIPAATPCLNGHEAPSFFLKFPPIHRLSAETSNMEVVEEDEIFEVNGCDRVWSSFAYINLINVNSD